MAGNADARDIAEALKWAKDNRENLARVVAARILGVKLMRIDEGKLPRITRVKWAGDHMVMLHFENGKTFSVNLTELVHGSKELRTLREVENFARVSLGEGGHSLEWPGELDMGADTLWELALRQNGHADAAQFIRWRWKHGLSLTAAAEALGMSRRQIGYYSSGEHEVPRTILLACRGWEAQLEKEVKVRLQRRAEHHGRSMEAEEREILRDAAKDDARPIGKLGSCIAARFRGQRLESDLPELRGQRPRTADLQE